MKANLVVAEMDPSRIDVACRAVSHELISLFQEQPGARRAYWLVDRNTGEVLVMTTWVDDEALAAERATDRSHHASVAERTGFMIRAVTSMDVLESDDAGLTLTAVARWARVTWIGVAARDRRAGPATERPEAVADERRHPGPCGAYLLNDAATGDRLAVSLWDRPPAEPNGGRGGSAPEQRPLLDLGVAVRRVAELQGVAVVARA